MPSRLVVRSLSILALALALVATTRSSARADAKVEGAAKALEQKAMQEDYLNTDFDKALEKLNQASNKCGAEKCSSIVRAQIKVEIGVVQIAGKQNRDAGMAAFVDALKIDSNAKVDDDLRTKDVDAAFAEAKNKVGSSSSAPAASDFTVQPAPATMVRTPLAVYATYAGTEALTKVVVKYKGFGMGEWKTLQAKSMDSGGWGVEIPCADVQQGDLLYYLQGFNANNDPVATGGDRNNPFKTAVKRDFSGEAPHFPGKEAPKQCAEAGDCPPDFPGCKKGGAERAHGRQLAQERRGRSARTTASARAARARTRSAPPAKGRSPRASARSSGLARPSRWTSCSCRAPTRSACSNGAALPVNTSGYYCTDSSGNDFPSRTNPAQNNSIQNGSDQVQGGFAPGDIRLMLTLRLRGDGEPAGRRAPRLRPQLVQRLRREERREGVRADPRGSPRHLGVRPRSARQRGARPVRDGRRRHLGVGRAGRGERRREGGEQRGTTQSYKAWVVSGPAFFSLGGGLRYAFTPHFAAMVGPRFNVAFGNASLISLSPELGVQYGF